jgi:lysophospholipase L1-like esterase
MTSGYSNPGPAWPVALDALRADLRLAHNSGVVGASSADMLAGLNREVYRYKPQVLIVLGGINDLYRGGSAAKVLANLEAIARNARAHGLTVVLLTMPHDLIRGIQPKIETLDNGLIAYGRANNVQVIDLRTVIKTHGDTVNNGCHFNALGVKAVAHKIAADLKV